MALAVGQASVGGAAPADGIGLPLRRVRFECDAWFDESAMRALMPLRRGKPVTAPELERAKAVLESSQVFRSIAVETLAEDGGAVVVFHLKRKRIVTEVTVHGYDYLKWRDVFRLLRVRTGSFYDPALIVAARTRLEANYRQNGYPHAHVSSAVTKRPGQADIRFDIDEGQPATIVAIVVTGDTGLASDELQHTVRTLVGQPNSRTAPRDGEKLLRRQLREAGYYDADIDSEWVPSGDDTGVLWFTIDAGTRSEVVFVGNESRSDKQLLELMDLNNRLIVTDGTWKELSRRIKRYYQEGGYYEVRVRLRIIEGDPRQVVFTIDQGRLFEVRKVRFAGNEQISSDALRAEMNTQPARWLPWPRPGDFVREVFNEDLRRLWFYYREQGFDDAEIVDAPVEVDRDTGSIVATVVIAEGPRTIVAGVHPPDLSGLPPAAQSPTLQVAPGKPLLPAELETDTQTILRALRSDGYTEATVEPEVTRRLSDDVAAATIEWRITRGPRREVGAIVVQGNVETHNDVITQQLPFKTGDPLDLERLQRGQDKVYQLGTYRSVGVQPLGAPENDVQDVGVSVMPRPPGSIQWGAGYNTRDGITGFGELTFDNVAHRARRITIRASGSVIPDDPSQTQFLALLGYREPRLFHSDWQWNSELIGERSTKTIDQFSVLRGSWGNGLARDLLPRLKGGAELQLERADVFNVEPKTFLAVDDGVGYTVAVSPFAIYDGRNDPFAPTSGFFESLRFRYAPPGLSTVQFGKVNLQHSQAFPLATWLSFIYSARVAYGHAFSGAPILPIRERYFLGGATTVRGFAENSLGPTDPFGNPTGGDLAMVLSLEWRVPIIYQLSAAVFNDNGALFLTQCDDACQRSGFPGPRETPLAAPALRGNAFTWKNIRHSVGPGLRYMTPVGPIGLDYGFKLARQPGESIGEVHFSISGTF